MKEEMTLAKKIYKQLIKNSWPGLGNDVQQICLKFGIADLNYHDNTKVNINQSINQCLFTEVGWLQFTSRVWQNSIVTTRNYETLDNAG